MPKLNPYLNFAGNAEEAFGFYKSVFGGEFAAIVRFKDMPMPGTDMSKEDEDKILHIALPIGDEMLMASDAPESMGFQVRPGNNFYISVNADSKAEADRLFGSLSGGGSIEMPLADQPWGDYYGSLTDKFGVNWMVSYSPPR